LSRLSRAAGLAGLTAGSGTPRLAAGSWMPRLTGLASSGTGLALTLAAATIVVASRRLGELDAQRREGLPRLGEDKGRQDRSDQQQAFRAHRDSRHSFNLRGIRALAA
jgi:hypothetical protein